MPTVRVALTDDKFIRFGSTHLDAQKENTNRVLQIKEIQRIASQDDLPMIIAGDFNAPPGSEIINKLDKDFIRTCEDCDPTVPVIQPKRVIDFIAFRPNDEFRIASHKVSNETNSSDHLPILAVVKY